MDALISALKACIHDEQLTLDRTQTMYLFFWLYALAEGDGAAMKFAQLDLLGSLGGEREEAI